MSEAGDGRPEGRSVWINYTRPHPTDPGARPVRTLREVVPLGIGRSEGGYVLEAYDVAAAGVGHFAFASIERWAEAIPERMEVRDDDGECG